MRFYKVHRAAPGSRWQRTQSDAKQLARQLNDRDGWRAVEVPTDSQGLAHFLNIMEKDYMPQPQQVLADEGNDDHVPVLSVTMSAPIEEVRAAALQPGSLTEFEKLPLATKLRYASTVIDECFDLARA